MRKILIICFLLAIPFLQGFKSRNFDVGVSQFNQGNYDKAIIKFERALKKYPTKAIIHYNLGMAYFKGRWGS